MSDFTEDPRNVAHVVEDDPSLSRRKVVILSGQVLKAGTVLGKFTSGGNSGKYKIYNQDATDGTQIVAGVLRSAVDATGADAEAIINDYHSVVADAQLIFPADIETAERAAAITQLDTALHIKAV